MKILQVCVDLDGGGIDRYLLNYCSKLSDIRFDFAIVDNKKVGILEKDIENLGSTIYRVPRQTGNARKNYQTLKKIMTENKYDAVHVHLGYKGFLALTCAKRCGIKVRIVHAHIAKEPENFKQKMLRFIFTILTKIQATHLFACGIAAAKWVWGKRAYKRNKVTIINNAIQSDKYRFDNDIREKARKELGLKENTFAIGHVGRLCAQKNQLRLLDIYKEIEKINPDSHLFMVGRGELQHDIENKINDLGLQDKITLLGVRDDVHLLLNAFDVFVFPSVYEGLPFTLIETQCNGLPALSSSAVTNLVKVGPCVNFIGLEKDDETWARHACALTVTNRAECYKDIIENGYALNVEAEKLRKYYEQAVQKVKRG